MTWASGQQQGICSMQRRSAGQKVLCCAAALAHVDWTTMSNLLSLHLDAGAFNITWPFSPLPEEVVAALQC